MNSEKVFKDGKHITTMERRGGVKSNYNTFLYSNLDKYKGKWIVILGEDIIAFGDNIKIILEEAKNKYPGKKFMLAKVPTEETLIY